MVISDPYERWLLEMVATLSYPVSLLCDPDLAVHLNRPGHGLSAEQVAPRVDRLRRAGLLALVDGTTERPVAPSVEDLIAEVQGQSAWGFPDAHETSKIVFGIYFKLTSKGGAVWEELAAPDWERFNEDVSDEHERLITGVKREHVEACIRPRLGDAIVDGATWTNVVPWQATYWKQLPAGVRCRIPSAELLITDEVAVPCSTWFRRVELPT